MVLLIVRLALLALGMGLIEIGLGNVFQQTSPIGWLPLVIGLLFLLAGSAGFMGALFGSGREKSKER